MAKKCRACGGKMYKYATDVKDDYMGILTFTLSFCWKCGHFAITPNVDNAFTTSILLNPEIIYELIKTKQLKPVP